MHIKFLEHGKGSPVKASAYVLDKLDHMGNVRAGVQVLRGDATTFNAICDSSPHLWKYTSGIIAWSKEDAPTDEQIKEVLNDFEQHAFAGLEQSQYHLFAVLHTDDDGSKHIHILTPRLDIQSGKSLNIAPPGHKKHFDSLRDYFNTKYQWSRPDDLLLMRTTQEPNHIVKLNKQAKKILLNQNIETLTKNQFCKAFDNYVRALLSTQTVKNRTDLIDCISALDGIDSIKPSKNFLAIILDNGKTHRLKGDFYHEQFEIESYTEHVRAAAESKPTANELAAALTDADQLRATYRAKREAYHQQHHAFTQRTADDNSPRAASTLDFERDRESITSVDKNAHNELYGANTSITSTAMQYRYIEHQNRHNQHRFVFNIHAGTTGRNQQPSPEPQYRSKELTEQYPRPGPTSNSKPKRTNPERHPDLNHGKIEYSESNLPPIRNDGFWSADSFNEFLTQLSSKFKLKNDQSATRRDSTELTNYYRPNQLLEQPTEVKHADRNRPFFERAKRLIDSTNQLVNRAKQRIESTSEFIKKHLEQIQRSRAELTKQNHPFENRERNPTSLDPGHEIRTFKARAGQLFGAVTASISKQCADPITDAINTSFEAAGFKQHCQQLSKNSIETHSIEYQLTASRPRERTLENLATESTRQLLRRFRDAEQANRHARGDSRKINRINQQLGQLEKIAAEIRLMPKPATDFQFSSLRNDNYYPDCVLYHKELCDKQQQAYDSKKLSLLIDYTKKKAENLETYMSRASRKLNKSDYNKIEQIIQNDQRMLKYRQCEKILEPQNSHFEQQRETYQTCLKHFENIKSDIEQIKNPSSQHNVSQNSYEPEYKAKPQNDLDFNF
ncbi:mobilization protein [Acinetobacter baumannii]|uniref:relaxase/mobilization nuclease domain-containing protein n=1 Tax=Acinetobacter baumannii TaxID=470 RepID=UPI0024B8743F|nr:mobilization protein [Acinetobacter baumannii]MDI9731872.1 mobilization protein [Acinetobacter baumannii]